MLHIIVLHILLETLMTFKKLTTMANQAEQPACLCWMHSKNSETIKHSCFVQRTLLQGFLISIPYPLLGKIQHHLETSPHIIDNIDYLEHVNLSVYTKAGEEDTFSNEIINLSNDQATIKE